MKHAVSLFALLLAYGSAHAESRKVSEFHAVELAGALTVDIAVGTATTVEVTGEADLLPKVSTTVKNGVLVIETEKHMKDKNHLKVAITVAQLDGVTLSGAGQITISGVSGDAFGIRMPGAGEIKVSGSTGAFNVVLDGSGEVNAKQLEAKSATIDLPGTGQVSAKASNAVDARLSGTGQIDVDGKPAKVKKSMTGVGEIRIR